VIIAYSLYDRIAVARVRAAFDRTDLLRADATEVRALVDAPRTCAALLFDLHTAARLGMPYFEWLQCHRRTAALVLYVAACGSAARAAFQLGQCGIDGVCVQGEDDSPTDLRRAVEAARLRAAAVSLSGPLAAFAPQFDHAVWATVLAHVPDLRTAREMAAVLGMTPRRLATRLREASLPGPRRFLAWCRLLRAAVLLEDASRTTESAGLAVNYASGPAFRNACQYLAGVQPSEIRRHGGAAFVLERLSAETCAGATPSRPLLRSGSHAFT
jgi:AraC-like DNA-binding protein